MSAKKEGKIMQWRLKKEQRWEEKDNIWQDHSQPGGDLGPLILNYNQNNSFFEYRVKPE